MTVFKNKLFVLLFVAITVTIFGWQWYSNRMQEVTKDQLVAKIQDGYTRQFCNVIFPHIADCVTMASDECSIVAQQSLQPCLKDLITSLPDRIGPSQAKEIYAKASDCFELNIRNEMQVKYLKPTIECKQKLS